MRTQVTQRWTPASVEVANLLRSRFGGNFSLQRSGNGHAKWNWQLNSRKACTFLCAIWPHVKLKRSQIAVAINFMENGMSGNYACQKLKRLKRSGA